MSATEIALPSRVRTSLLRDGTYSFEDFFEAAGQLTPRIVTGAAWLFELYELEHGELLFVRDGLLVRAKSNRFGALFPPFTISRICFRRARGRVFGVASTAPLPSDLPRVPVLFETARVALESGREVADVLRAAKNIRQVPAFPNASALSHRAKALIDQHHSGTAPISRVALQLGVTAAHLSRQFRRDFDMSPREYLHQLRIADAPLKLATGAEIAFVSHQLGYNDLTRFYTQFRKATKTSPGVCRAMVLPAGTVRKQDQKPPRHRALAAAIVAHEQKRSRPQGDVRRRQQSR